jgi:hypothetical protein
VIAPKDLRDRQQWLLWRFEPNAKKPGGKKLKVPYYINAKRRMGVQGSAEDRGWLSLYNSVVDELTRSRATRLPFDGIGFAFLPGDGLIGIDLDDMIDEDGVISERGTQIIKACDSYTELSPSKKGVHIFVRGQVDKSFKSNDIGVEVFCGGQYFTFTGDHYSGTPLTVNEISELTLRRLQKTVAKAKGQGDASRPAPAAPADDKRAKVESALSALSPDCDYDTWLHIGMAVHAELGDGGLMVWDYWSGKGGKYRGFKDLESHWKSFKPGGGITGATLFKFAKDAGWRAPRALRPSASPRPENPGGTGNALPPAGGGGDSSGGEADPPDDGRPLIRVRMGQLPNAVDLAEDALLDFPERIYQRSGFITRVVKRDRPSVRNYKRPAGTLGVHTVDQNYLLELFNRAARWEKWNVKTDNWVRCHCPDQVASFYLARTGRWKLPRLWSVISAPTLRPDGTVLQQPGYDEATCTYYDPCGIKFPEIPDEPTHDQAQAALAALKELFKSFPFESELDRSVALALALTALVRRALPSSPLGAFTAPIMGSGKTLLADCINILAAGVSAPAMTYPEREEEAEKTALSVLMEGDPVVLIDNVERPLQGAWLCSILTQEVYQQRVLGRSEMMRVPTTTLWLATGNQLVVAGDLRTRTLLCRIDPKSEHPEQREFGGDLREWTTRERPRLVAAGLTLIRAFIATGTPVAEICKPWGRFERWSEMVRAPLIWLDCDDPCRSLAALEGEDPERNELARMLHNWHACFGTEPTSAREAVERVLTMPPIPESDRLLGDVLKEIAAERGGGLSVRRLGKWLQKHGGRRIGGRFFVKAQERDHVALWKVEGTEKGGATKAG